MKNKELEFLVEKLDNGIVLRTRDHSEYGEHEEEYKTDDANTVVYDYEIEKVLGKEVYSHVTDIVKSEYECANIVGKVRIRLSMEVCDMI